MQGPALQNYQERAGLGSVVKLCMQAWRCTWCELTTVLLDCRLVLFILPHMSVALLASGRQLLMRRLCATGRAGVLLLAKRAASAKAAVKHHAMPSDTT